MTLEETGPLQVDFTPRSGCPFPFEDLGAEAPELPADLFRLEVVAIDGLRAGLEWHLEASAIRWFEDTPAVAALIPAADEPLRLVPDVEVVFPINVLNEAGERVAWDLSQGRVLERRDGAAARELSPIEDEDSWWPVSVKAGERSTISLAVGGAELPVVEVVATPVEQARSLEIVTVSDGLSFGARAVVRDGEGQVIYGAPVEWSVVEGEVAVGPLELYEPPEYTMIFDGCTPPPAAMETRRAVVRAQLGELADEVALEWVAEPEDEPSDEAFAPDPNCQRGAGSDAEIEIEDRGCGCASDRRGGAGGWSWLTVLAVVLYRRRLSGRVRQGRVDQG